MSVANLSPSKLELLKIPSGGDFIIGRMFIAEGEEPKPTILLLHGFPGVMLNLDIAASLQQKGWNVLVINYRGAWGSQGKYSISNAIEDVKAALQYIKQNEVAKENRIDVNRIGLVGHSFGGFLALKTASQDPSIQVVASLSGANFPLFLEMIEQNPSKEAQIFKWFDDSAFFLNDSNGRKLLDEISNHSDDWNTFLFAPTLNGKKLLLTAVTNDDELPKEDFHDPLIEILENNGVSFENIIFETDHNYNNKRTEITETIHDWLLQNL